ncbi:14874_t:CDS:2, partial [Gigaspora margarita]
KNENKDWLIKKELNDIKHKVIEEVKVLLTEDSKTNESDETTLKKESFGNSKNNEYHENEAYIEILFG